MFKLLTCAFLVATLGNLCQGRAYFPDFWQNEMSKSSEFDPLELAKPNYYKITYRPFHYGNLHGFTSSANYQYQTNSKPKYLTSNGFVNKFRTSLPTTQRQNLAQLQAKKKIEIQKIERLVKLEKKLQSLVRREYDDALVQVLLRILESSRGSKPVIPRAHLEQFRMALLEFLFPKTQVAKDLIVNGTSHVANNQTVATTELPKDAPQATSQSAGLSNTNITTTAVVESTSAQPVSSVAGKDPEGAQLFNSFINGNGRARSLP